MSKSNAVLFIDAENIPPSMAGAIIEEAGRQGSLVYRGVYGDFSRPALASWLDVLPRHALTACQTVSCAAGKNGADIALVIGVMDLLHMIDADVFCLATCDGDFTQLAMRIRQGGKTVVGMGMPRASTRFRAACDLFKIISPKEQTKPATSAVQRTNVSDRALKGEVLQRAFIAAPRTDGEWVRLPDLMKALKDC